MTERTVSVPAAPLRLLAAAGLVVGLLGFAPAAVATEEPNDPATEERTSEPQAATSISLLPADPAPDDPHNGTWFVLTLEPGQAGEADAAVTNTTDAEVEVSLRISDLSFRDDGTPVLGEDPSSGVAGWGRFDEQTLKVGPHETVRATFRITVPSGTLPRDYAGAAVAETVSRLEDGTTLVNRVATRIVVTVPGAADRGFEISGVEVTRDSVWWPSEVVVRVTVENTGEIRTAPRVTVAGELARGSRMLLSRTSETYIATVDVDAVGGLVRLPIEAVDPSGLTRRVDRSLLVLPRGWLAIVGGLLIVAVFVGWWRRRRDRVAALHADVRRLEALVTRMRGADERVTRPVLNPQFRLTTEQALEAALRSARRASESDSFARAALALHELTGEALTPLLEALGMANGSQPELIEAAATYGQDAIADHHLAEHLPDEVFAAVLERAARPVPGSV